LATRTFPASLNHLSDAVAYVASSAADHGLPPERRGTVELVAEELLVNIITHAYPDGDGLTAP
jgi:anti-sigma regulatory factor (Ser/Thr protein kinase)